MTAAENHTTGQAAGEEGCVPARHSRAEGVGLVAEPVATPAELGTKVSVEIISDVVCPWCWVGKRRLEKAVDKWGGEVEITWRAFQLDPGAPEVSVPAVSRYAAKFGGEEAAAKILHRMHAVGEGEGLDLNIADAVHGNTRRAHRVLELAHRLGGSELQDALAERLFRAYFTESRDIADEASLVELAAEAGLDRSRVQELFATGEGEPAVDQDLRRADLLGVTGVPFFIFDGKVAVPGAQDPDVLSEVLADVVKQREAAAGEPSNDDADPCADGSCSW